MRNLFAVAVLTVSQFTAFPFLAIVVANTAHQIEAGTTDTGNVTVVYKTDHGRRFETL